MIEEAYSVRLIRGGFAVFLGRNLKRRGFNSEADAWEWIERAMERECEQGGYPEGFYEDDF